MSIQSLISRALDQGDHYVLGSLDLSAAFDVANRELFFKRMDIMGIPEDLKALIRDWLSERICYVEAGGHKSAFFNCDFGILQLSVLGQLNNMIEKRCLDLTLETYQV